VARRAAGGPPRGQGRRWRRRLDSYSAGFGNVSASLISRGRSPDYYTSDETGADGSDPDAEIDYLSLRREDPVHDLGAGGDCGAQFAAVYQFGGAGLLVAGEPGDLLNRDAACGHDAYESVP
jgi:hypothetical protein